jgi:hypothetical protein
MCKVMIMTNITDKTRDKAIKFIKEMGEKISVGNNDGLGYAAIDENDNLFAERWFKNSNAFKKPIDSPFLNAVSFKPIEYSSHGMVNLNEIAAITLHTRMATCEKSLKNIHPFIKDDVALIHNGVIRNPEVYKPTISTCDSESLLNGYLEHKVMDNPSLVESMVDPLTGYWASAVFAKVNGKYILDIFKHSANLSAVYVYDLETWVFSTNHHDIETVCSKLGFKHSEAGDVGKNVLIRLNPMTGEVITTLEYKKEDAPRVTQPSKSYTDYNSYYNSRYSTDYGYGGRSSNESNCLTYSELQKQKEAPAKVTVLDGKTFAEFVMKKSK